MLSELAKSIFPDTGPGLVTMFLLIGTIYSAFFLCQASPTPRAEQKKAVLRYLLEVFAVGIIISLAGGCLLFFLYHLLGPTAEATRVVFISTLAFTGVTLGPLLALATYTVGWILRL